MKNQELEAEKAAAEEAAKRVTEFWERRLQAAELSSKAEIADLRQRLSQAYEANHKLLSQVSKLKASLETQAELTRYLFEQTEDSE